MDYEIQQKEEGDRGMFYIEDDHEIIGELTYTKQENGILLIDHTEVDKEVERKGIGSSLVKKSVEYARENNLKIDPLCSFAEEQFNRNSSYSDVRIEPE